MVVELDPAETVAPEIGVEDELETVPTIFVACGVAIVSFDFTDSPMEFMAVA